MAPTINMTDALKEAYAVAKTDAFPYYTFEFVHPSWDPPARIVYGWDEIECQMEEDYLVDVLGEAPGASPICTFYPVPIEFTMPATVAEEVPVFDFKFYDPSRIVMLKIFEAQDDPQPVQMYVRVYLSNRLLSASGPETLPVPRYHVGSVRINKATSLVTGRCVFQDFMGRSVPFRTYTLAEFPGLRRR